MGSSSPPPAPESSGVLLDQLLGSLLGDFSTWFERGLVLLDHCPETVMPEEQQHELRDRLELARKELSAASSLRQAAPIPMALEMETLAPWHKLVLTVWNLSASLRMQGVPLPEMEWPAGLPLPGAPGSRFSEEPSQ
ncbi:DUF2605 family protein [Cyanobium sp. Aljojuca 7D2]|uniref:DUF2605 family protein n=1 Tax=Cyanobium sp. Aljojuca 7D2 TaxID=2823698 RepID=UPI0020CCD4AA|nr:DUF2605 family protein [Cyanobium sp. Aljojuca 7D2]MCP9889839.1 DUF2605 family protein [Cyanobium sp. Aljojuca 7D2]